MTKSQTVMHTMMLAIVMYSDLCCHEAPRTSRASKLLDAPIHPMSCVPQRLLDQVDTQYKNQRTHYHNGCMYLLHLFTRKYRKQTYVYMR